MRELFCTSSSVSWREEEEEEERRERRGGERGRRNCERAVLHLLFCLIARGGGKEKEGERMGGLGRRRGIR